MRFRANLYLRGWPAWHEFDLLGQTLAIGEARLKVVKRTMRCAAINVDPDTAARDLNIPHTLMRRFGHADCGVYAEVVAGGAVADGDDRWGPEVPALRCDHHAAYDGGRCARPLRISPSASHRRRSGRADKPIRDAMAVIAGHHDRIAEASMPLTTPTCPPPRRPITAMAPICGPDTRWP